MPKLSAKEAQKLMAKMSRTARRGGSLEELFNRALGTYVESEKVAFVWLWENLELFAQAGSVRSWPEFLGLRSSSTKSPKRLF